VNPTNNNTS